MEPKKKRPGTPRMVPRPPEAAGPIQFKDGKHDVPEWQWDLIGEPAWPQGMPEEAAVSLLIRRGLPPKHREELTYEEWVDQVVTPLRVFAPLQRIVRLAKAGLVWNN